jgi:hypothetical protein
MLLTKNFGKLPLEDKHQRSMIFRVQEVMLTSENTRDEAAFHRAEVTEHGEYQIKIHKRALIVMY